jgi:hypothetical protein
VRATDRPVTIETMHAMITKTHPNARTILYYINSSLAKLKESGEYDRIVERHLQQFWDGQEASAAPPPATPPAAATAEQRSTAKQTSK